MHYLHIPRISCADRTVTIDWIVSDQNSVRVRFLPNNEWSVEHEKHTYETNGPDPSFWMDEDDGSRTPHFFLEDNIAEEISRHEQWTQQYEPKVYRKRIMWCTNYWDGPLAGYCTDGVGNDIYYFDCVEEKMFRPGSRMYAVYELSPQEQVDACRRHAAWIAIWKTPWRRWWWMHRLFTFRNVRDLLRLFSSKTDEQRREEWRREHKLIGYFHD